MEVDLYSHGKEVNLLMVTGCVDAGMVRSISLRAAAFLRGGS
ncbi:hypothetical protein [Rossellomorea marisflavi]|nr:hypothetical protein [Rossellomorea marisflavi]